MSKKAQALLANARNVKRKEKMPAHQRRRLEHQERVLRYNNKEEPKTVEGKVLATLKNNADADVGNIQDYVYARWNTMLTPSQVYRAVNRLRKKGEVAQYEHSYKKV